MGCGGSAQAQTETKPDEKPHPAEPGADTPAAGGEAAPAAAATAEAQPAEAAPAAAAPPAPAPAAAGEAEQPADEGGVGGGEAKPVIKVEEDTQLKSCAPGWVRGHRKTRDQKVKRVAARTEPRRIDWSCAVPEKWEYIEKEFTGSMSYKTAPVFEEETAPIEDGLAKLKANPVDYMGFFYQSSMTEWPADQQKYTLIKRTKSGFGVQHVPGGGFTFIRAKYEALDPSTPNEPDGVTEGLNYHGQALAAPLRPGRGVGVADVPMIKIMGDVDPNDISQGGVGDCWLLSAISAMAEFDGCVHRLFQKTEGIDEMPRDTPNKYVITLYDVTQDDESDPNRFKPVDIVIDETLCSNAEGSGLLGCSATITGELWAAYLEKACALHCGGWDKIDGGQCTHAWRLLTGCKRQYTFKDSGSGWACYGAYNPNEDKWEQLANSPHDGFRGLWPMVWPEVGGGGELSSTIDKDAMFEKLCAFDDENFIMGCGTKAGSDSEDTEGIVDGHAYTILACESNVGGTDWDLVKVRNPWGKGEFTSGQWDDDGPGWDQYPAVKEVCKPVKADDGVFWVSKDEFFEYFHTVYLCARDMSTF